MYSLNGVYQNCRHSFPADHQSPLVSHPEKPGLKVLEVPKSMEHSGVYMEQEEVAEEVKPSVQGHPAIHDQIDLIGYPDAKGYKAFPGYLEFPVLPSGGYVSISSYPGRSSHAGLPGNMAVEQEYQRSYPLPPSHSTGALWGHEGVLQSHRLVQQHPGHGLLVYPRDMNFMTDSRLPGMRSGAKDML